LIYFGSRSHEIHNNPGLKKYLIRIGIFHTADSSLQGDFKNGLKRSFSLFSISKTAWLVSLLIICTPGWVISSFKKLVKR
jgi:hypothetical protein